MNASLITILLLCIPMMAIAQKRRNRPALIQDLTPAQIEEDSQNHDCRVTAKYSRTERLSFYPFNVAQKISIVSFNNLDTGRAIAHEIPLVAGEIDYTKILETRVLSGGQIDSLTSILYNVEYLGPIYVLEGFGCYNPRNAVLFFDSNNHLIEFIELCFECHGQRLSSEKISMGDLCSQKSEMLRKFFLKIGIKVGTSGERE